MFITEFIFNSLIKKIAKNKDTVIKISESIKSRYFDNKLGGARGVMVVGNGHGDTSSNPERDWLHFPLH